VNKGSGKEEKGGDGGGGGGGGAGGGLTRGTTLITRGDRTFIGCVHSHLSNGTHVGD